MSSSIFARFGFCVFMLLFVWPGLYASPDVHCISFLSKVRNLLSGCSSNRFFLGSCWVLRWIVWLGIFDFGGRARAGSLTRTPTARARGGRTVAPAPVQRLLSHTHHRLHAHAESEQSRPRPCKGYLSRSLTHRLHAHAVSEQSHPRPCRRAGLLTHTQTVRTRGERTVASAHVQASLFLTHRLGLFLDLHESL